MFGGGKKIKISDELYSDLDRVCQMVGSSSVEELIERILKAEVEKLMKDAGKQELTAAEIDDIANKMKGLGYIE